ncbi:MAG TPA: rod shape-determining protein MreD [Chitinophagales bacterium]|nr:rod shape-determining protein MreD [Chitinophagales bacterium]
MLSNIFSIIIRFVLLTFAQVMILNNVHLHGLFNPYLYPLFILLLPLETPTWLLLLLGFFSGWVIDWYSHTGGLHASASVLVAFLRPAMLNLLKPTGGYLPEDRPTISSMGFTWFLTYCSILVFIHHLYLFIIETFSFTQLVFVIEKIVVSSIVSITLMIILQYLFYKRKTRAIT